MKEEAKSQFAHERHSKRIKLATYIILGVAALVAIFTYIKTLPPPAGKYDDFAKCIANSSTTFYGAYWCPHCQNQKRMFGTSADYLPYVECSLPDASGQTQVCIDAGVKNYPTWVFKDGSRLTGEVQLSDLAQKTGCPLTDSNATPAASSSASGTSSSAASPAKP